MSDPSLQWSMKDQNVLLITQTNELPYFSHAAEEQSDQTQVQAMKKKRSFYSNTVQSKNSRQALRALVRKEYTSPGKLTGDPLREIFLQHDGKVEWQEQNSYFPAEMKEQFGAIRTQTEHPPALVSAQTWLGAVTQLERVEKTALGSRSISKD